MTHGLTQKQFALKTGIGYSSLCKYETGYVISKKNINKICSYFNLPENYFD
ncbi:helix-turn-helix domain-containing protein [Clostridium paraputrificum]|uniref:helix-turn-helix domain-containing protein n=1 Tax=Clostridium paraputrificum TaxID=29363 RepID=UPI0024813A63|nr:helix-turn-helix transcriptional regulator [Clostridium paraputrificum]MDB2087626.1 helix-turn-helix transcriptional regulator [Clostridium paraputrificum]